MELDHVNLWLRLLWLLVSCAWRPRLDTPLSVSELRFRVWPHDLDTSLHMTNGRYWALMDLGRTDLLLRTGLWRSVLKRRWTPVVSAAEIRFRRELRLFQPLRLQTRVRAWTETHIVIEHRMLAEGDVVAAIALVQGALYDRAGRRYVAIAELMEASGTDGQSPGLDPEIEAFLAAGRALQAVTADPPPAPASSDGLA